MKRISVLLMFACLLPMTSLADDKPKAIETYFDDVPPGHAFFHEVETGAAVGITNGCATRLFCPDRLVTRAEAAVLLSKAAGVFAPPDVGGETFSDVPANHFAYLFIEDAHRRRIIDECSAGSFCPDGPLTREQAAVWVVKSLGRINPIERAQFFSDVGRERAGYLYVNFLAFIGGTAGCADNAFCPDLPITRAQFVAFIVRAFQP